MKEFLIILIILCSKEIFSQQNLNANFLSKTTDFDRITLRLKDSINTLNLRKDEKHVEKSVRVESDKIWLSQKPELAYFGISGIGNLNEETFKTLNGSGKISLFVRPVQLKRSKQRLKTLTIYASYNINASNNDSILYSTLVFPEVGNNSFLGTVEWSTFWKSYQSDKIGHSLTPFFEFSYKNIRTDSSENGQRLYFSTLNYTSGLRYSFHYFKKAATDKDKDIEASFFVTPYLSAFNIPDEDKKDYQAILTSGKSVDPASLSDHLFSAGVKIGFWVNNFGVFADFRSLLGSNEKIPIREMKGFHSNIGILFNASFFELKD